MGLLISEADNKEMVPAWLKHSEEIKEEFFQAIDLSVLL